jgi:hypothetical protein
MPTSWINRLGNWNPQLLREYRGRVKSRSVIAAIAVSVMAQILLLLIFLQDSDRTAPERWLDLWKTMTWLLPYVLFPLGSYYIVSDLTQEEKRGTLNFIRLSPRPAWGILLGKLLGVPLLPYLTVGLAIPLHWVAALGAGIPLILMLSFYLLLGLGCLFCYSAAMLFGLVGGTQGLANRQATTAVSFAAIALIFLVPLFMYWNIGVTWHSFGDSSEIFSSNSGNVFWWYAVINRSIWLSHVFTLSILGIATYLLWQVLLRRFRQPRLTVISKRQSYAIVAYLEVLFLGFCLQPVTSANYSSGAALFMYSFTSTLLLALMFGICPQRQALLDWAQAPAQDWQGLIWADKSPCLIAVAIQILIANALLLPWALITGAGDRQPLETVMVCITVSNLLLIFGVFIQLVFAAKIRNPSVWAVGGVSAWSILPPVVLGILKLTPDQNPGTIVLWTFFGYPFWNVPIWVALPLMGLGIIAQWLLLAALLWRFQQTLGQLKAVSQTEAQ